jgi:phage shock protein E
MDTSRPSPRGRAVRAAAALLTSLAVGLAGCGGDPVATAVTTVAAAPGLPAGTILIDVRTPAEFATGHLEGALNLPVELPGFDAAVAALDPAAEYLVYCRSGRRAEAAVEIMGRAGLEARNIGSVAEASAETGVRVVG